VISKLEIYGIVLVVLALGFIGAYFKGRHDEQTVITERTLADNARALQGAADAAIARASADDAARQKATDFIASIDQGLANVQARFSKLPAVVVDAHGCERLTDAGRLRWNAAELLPAGSPVDPAGGAPATVSAGPVPAP